MTTSELLKRLQLPAGWCEVNVGVALSGGADSMALLRSLQKLGNGHGGPGKLLAFHVNHRLRGVDSDGDARWCREQCEKLDIPLQVLTAETAEYAVENGQGIEAAAREQRYLLLTTAAEQAGVRYLATAHTKNDQVETILFRTLRGTGLRGLAGIPVTRQLTPSLSAFRPLLSWSRSDVTDYLAELEQEYRTDHSNADEQFTRNRLRHNLLPKLREDYNAELDSALVRLSSQAADAQAVIERLAEALLERAAVRVENSRLSLNSDAFSGQEQIIVCEAFRILWRNAGLAEQSMTYEWWCQLAGMVRQPGDSVIHNLPGNVRASIDGKRFVLQW